MSLRTLQSEFAALVPRLIDKAISLGYEVTLGDAYRDPRAFGAIGLFMAYGHPKSAHKKRLAIDLNLFKNGVFLEGTDAHKELGEWWKQQHPLARWGGDFQDGNHYSFEHEGMK
ncbi:MAG TPA: hypothetical protein PLB04_04885 [Nitrospira sp.]|nr:hypothetical protein [Nitrospira sp.]